MAKTFSMDPYKIKVTSGRCIVKLAPPPESRAGIIVPENHREKSTEGSLAVLPERLTAEYEHLAEGDKVWFSRWTGEDDSMFLEWEGARYVLIPLEALQVAEPLHG